MAGKNKAAGMRGHGELIAAKQKARGIFPAPVFEFLELQFSGGYSDLTFFTIAAASMPKCASNSSDLPERGRAVTASL